MQELLYEFITNSSKAFFILQAEKGQNKLTWANKAFGDMFGLLPNEVVSSQLEHLLLNKVECDPLRRVDSTNVAISIFGERHLVDVASIPLKEPYWMVEVTAQSKNDGKNSMAEEKLGALADVAPTGIFYSGVGLRIDYVNHQFISIFGQSASSLLGVGWLDFIEPNDRDRLADSIVKVINSEDPSYKTSFRSSLTKRGEKREIVFYFRHILNSDKSNGFVGTVEDITDRISYEKQLRYLVNHDVLTGALNRQALTIALQDFERQYNSGQIKDLFLFFLDLNRFKHVNDTYGHNAGDSLLIEIAKRLSKSLPKEMQTYRYAGDEFVCLLPVTSDGYADVVEVTDLISNCFYEQFDLGDNVFINSEASIGVSLFSITPNVEDLINSADEAMYQNKKSSKNCLPA
jgi:diguanylate cyclase (GGDEF)-like protein/PAS domain S-box-containing protein